MTETVLIAALVPVAAVISAWLGYRTNRERDAPRSEVERGRLELDNARAASEAWAEYATTVRDDLTEIRQTLRIAEARIALLQTERSDHLEQIEKARLQIITMKSQVESLQANLNDYLERHRDEPHA